MKKPVFLNVVLVIFGLCVLGLLSGAFLVIALRELRTTDNYEAVHGLWTGLFAIILLGVAFRYIRRFIHDKPDI